jgi:hypothetical protein
VNEIVYYLWNDCGEIWDSFDNVWEDAGYVTVPYKLEKQSTLYSSGEYVILANSCPYTNVEKPTGVEETLKDSGIGTILKKEFRYSVDGDTFSEFQELNTANLISLGPFCKVWFQFRYILLSGGPVTITKVVLNYEEIKTDPYYGYVAPAIQDESKIYAFPVTYKSNFLWEPYKMNRAIRLYKDLNLMVNNLFGHDVTYYRVLPQGRSKDVFLMEYSLYEHEDGTCMKVVVPNNEFPDNKLNMGPFGVDFELPFEVQVDRDYFQKIFGDGSGPQKRDVLYFPRTNRIYEVSSSYLFRDFMNEPLYFKVTLIKWLPKTNVDQSESLDTLESYTASAGKLFGEEISQEEIKVTDPQQFNVAYSVDDPVRQNVYGEQEITAEDLQNYYTTVSEHYYKMESALKEKKIYVAVDSQFLQKDQKYYARYAPTSTQPDSQYYYSMKKFTYLGKNDDGVPIFRYEAGFSLAESQFLPSQIFFPGSNFQLYDAEYDGTTDVDSIASCSVDPAKFYRTKVVQYKARNIFSSEEDRAFSAWFSLKDNTSGKIAVSNFNLDVYTKEVTVNLPKPLLVFIGDTVALTRSSGGSFSIFGEVSEVLSATSLRIRVDQEILDYVQANFSTWTQYTDILAQRSFSRVFLNSIKDGKGVKVELYENRHFKITLNNEYSYFSLPNNILPIENSKWYAIFINFSNTYKQLTVNLWKLQWDPVSKLPATTDLKLVYNRTSPLTREDRSSDLAYFLEPSYMNLTNVRLFNRTAETDKQVLILNQNIVKDAQWAIIIDNALPQSKLPYIGYTR